MDYRPIVRERAQALGVDPNLAEALLVQESGGNPNAVSPVGARGLMQLMPGTARELGVDPRVPEQNIDGGLRYLKQQVDKFGVAGGLAAYNAGPGRVQRVGMQFDALPAETRNYVPSIMNRAALIAERNGPMQPQPTEQRPMDIPTLMGGYQKAAAANDTEAVTEIGGLIQKKYQDALSKAQAANDTEAVAEIQGAMQQFGTPKAAATAPATVDAPQAAAKAPAQEKKKEEPRSVFRRVDDFVRGVADTVTFGYADEIAAKMDALVGGGQSGKTNYKDAVAAQRERDAQGGAERIAGQIGGAFVPGAAAVGAVRAVPTAGRLARAGAGAATGAVQGGLYGSGSAEEGQRLEGAAKGALTGAAVGGVLGGVLPASQAQKSGSFIKNSGDEAAARLDAEIITDIKKIADSQTKRGNPVTAIDLNAVEGKYINEVNRAVTALGKVDKNFDAGPLRAALQDRRALTPDDLAPLRNSAAGNAVADAIEKAQRARSLTQSMQSSGGLMPLLREGVDFLPIPAAVNRGLKAALGGRQTREVAAQKVLNQADTAQNVLERLGPSSATKSSQELLDLVAKAQASRQAQVTAGKQARVAKSTKEANPQAAIADLQSKDPTYILGLGNRLGAPRNANEMAEFSRVIQAQMEDRVQKEVAKAPKKGPMDTFMQKAMSDSEDQLLKVREFQQLGDNPKDIVGLAAKATPAPTSVDELPISDIIRKVSLETDAAFIPNGKTLVGNGVKNILSEGKTTKAASTAQKAAAKAEAKVADKEAKALAEKARVDSFLSGELPGNLSTEAGGFQSTLKYVNGTADEISAGLRQLAKDRPDLAPNIIDMFVPGKKAKNLYEIQNNLFKTLGKREQPAPALAQSGGALTSETSRVFNQPSYEATVRTAEAARDAAINAAPSASLKQFAIDVANEKNPAIKAQKLQERVKETSDPNELGFLLYMVEPLTKFGKKAKK